MKEIRDMQAHRLDRANAQQKESDEQRSRFNADRSSMIHMTSIEGDVNSKLITKLVWELEESHKLMRQLKNVLRIPLLYNKYRVLM